MSEGNYERSERDLARGFRSFAGTKEQETVFAIKSTRKFFLLGEKNNSGIIASMKLLKKKLLMIALLLVIIFIFIAGLSYVTFLRKSHSSFENYYAFRECAQLLQRTADYGLCKTDKGQTIKIVKFQNKWYLDKDLPICFAGLCF